MTATVTAAVPTGSGLEARVLHWAREIRAWGLEWKSGIYPGEMAAFLALCDAAGVRTVVESGRGEHAYSTQVLGEYAERRGIRVVSIDYAPVRGQAFAATLARYRVVRPVTGNAFDVLPAVMRDVARPVALLVDGPKMRRANVLSAVATAVYDVAVVAHHNCLPEAAWGRRFRTLFPGAFRYEDLTLPELAEWREFKAWEAAHVAPTAGTPGRSLAASSLTLAEVRGRRRGVAARAFVAASLAWFWPRWAARQVVPGPATRGARAAA